MDENETKICPGDLFELSYFVVPIIRDMQCFQTIEDAQDDYLLGGKNDWIIEEYSKYYHGGFAVQLKRTKWTEDNFDYVFKESLQKLYYELKDITNAIVDKGMIRVESQDQKMDFIEKQKQEQKNKTNSSKNEP